VKAINLFSLLVRNFDLSFSFIFQIVDVNFAVDSPNCNSVSIVAECY
jgi:hypothetical protein